MASRAEIERLRLLARERHRAATKKASRLRRAKGIEVSGTKLDPRREPGNLKRYNAKQLESYIGQLDKFISRETTWVRGAGKNTLLSGPLFHEYKQLERKLNRKNAKPFEKIKDVPIPSLGTTVEGFQGMKPTHPTTQNPSSRAPHIPINKSPKGITSDKQLQKLIKETQKKLATDYSDKVIARDQKVMKKFFKDISKVSPTDKVKQVRKDFWSLTPAQFAFLWNYTNFSDTASMDYEIAKDHLHDNKTLTDKSDSFNTQINHMQNLINDVKRMKI